MLLARGDATVTAADHLRRVERRTRLRAEWTADGSTYRFFDYAFKSERPA
jgi:hypothetical protein